MIVLFSVEPEALEASLEDNPLLVQAHYRLLEAWQACGAFVWPEDEGRQRMRKAIERYPTGIRNRWQKAFGHFRTVPAGDARPSLLCVDPSRGEHFGIPLRRVSRESQAGRPEVCRFDCADRAILFQAVRQRAHEGISRGTPVDELWRERFATLARLGRHFVLVDRYALTNLIERKPAVPTGLERLLGELDAIDRPAYVDIYTMPTKAPYEAAVDALVSSLRGPGIQELTLRLAPNGCFINNAHDRHFRVDRTLIQLGKGIEVLSGEKVGASSDFDLKVVNVFARQREATLRQSSSEACWERIEGEGLVLRRG